MRIYVDTSVFGGCYDPEFEYWSNRFMNDFVIGKNDVVISEVTEFELKFAPEHIKEILMKIPQENIKVVKLTEEAKQLSSHYLKEKIVGESSLADTQHIAIATIQQVDLLVSWNFKHIVNYNKIRLYNSINLKYGYKLLEIRSPRDLYYE